jgi:hypothetical protein
VDIETIRQELEFYTGRFPADAVRSAIEQREAMTPVLLASLQKVAEVLHLKPLDETDPSRSSTNATGAYLPLPR